MHRHDLDLIAALADGSLDDEDRARSLIESCEVCRDEYDAQRGVLRALGTLGPPVMTELERAVLHREVLSGITTARPGAPSAGNAPIWSRWAYAAAALVVVAGVAGVWSQVGGLPANQLSTAEESPEIPPTEGSYDRGLSGAEATPGVAGGETTSGGDSAVSAYQPLIDHARSVMSPAIIAEYANSVIAARALECLDDSGLGRDEYRIIGRVTEATRFLLAVPLDEDLDRSTTITVIDFDTCEVVAVDE